MNKKQIIEFIEKILGGPLKKDNSDFYETVQNLFENDNLNEAINILEDFLADNSNDTKAIALYITVLTKLKKFNEVQEFIKSLNKTVITNQDVQSSITNSKMLHTAAQEPELETILSIYNSNPNNIDNVIKLSDKYFVEKKIEESFELLFNNFFKFKNKEKERIKKTLLKYFDALGIEHEQTKVYRRKLSSILFS